MADSVTSKKRGETEGGRFAYPFILLLSFAVSRSPTTRRYIITPKLHTSAFGVMSILDVAANFISGAKKRWFVPDILLKILLYGIRSIRFIIARLQICGLMLRSLAVNPFLIRMCCGERYLKTMLKLWRWLNYVSNEYAICPSSASVKVWTIWLNL